MRNVVRLNENDIENLVKKIIREEDEMASSNPKEEKRIELLQTNNGELSSVEDVIQMVSGAGQKFGTLCQQVTGNDGCRTFITLRNQIMKIFILWMMHGPKTKIVNNQ